MPWLVAAAMIIGGGTLTAIIYYYTEDEYPLTYWLAWGITIGGLLVLIAGLSPQRMRYIGWSTGLGVLLSGLFLVGKVDDEFLPPAWIGLSIIVTNVLLLVLGAILPTNLLAGLFGVGTAILGYVGATLRRREAYGYDAAYCGAAICAVVALMGSTHLFKTPLEYTNEVTIARLNETIQAAQERTEAYTAQLNQAQTYREQIDREFGDDDAAYLDMADQYIETAAQRFQPAQAALQQAGAPEDLAVAHSPELEARLATKTAQAELAATEAQAALDQLGGVQQLFESLSTEWIKEYLWFEVDGYWTSEENESPSYNVCYFGERVSTRNGDGTTETLVSDEADRTGSESFFSSDNQGVDWKYFTVADYNELVNTGVVPAASNTISNDEDAGNYLCGRNPQGGQYGALGEPPVVIEKAYGSLTREVGDEGASFVGDERYGTWCVPQPNGPPQPIPSEQTPPANAQWCWYQKPGASTGYYWERQRSGGSFIWLQSHRRCTYCSSQPAWGGGDLVPDGELARVNGTDGSSTRGPADQGGGPGAGK